MICRNHKWIICSCAHPSQRVAWAPSAPRVTRHDRSHRSATRGSGALAIAVLLVLVRMGLLQESHALVPVELRGTIATQRLAAHVRGEIVCLRLEVVRDLGLGLLLQIAVNLHVLHLRLGLCLRGTGGSHGFALGLQNLLELNVAASRSSLNGVLGEGESVLQLLRR